MRFGPCSLRCTRTARPHRPIVSPKLNRLGDKRCTGGYAKGGGERTEFGSHQGRGTVKRGFSGTLSHTATRPQPEKLLSLAHGLLAVKSSTAHSASAVG